MSKAYIGIGTNIEPRFKRMQGGIERLESLGTIIARSSIYETPPFGYTDQPDFLNAVVVLETALTASELHKEMKSLELDLGRQYRDRWHEREIDFDLLLLDEQIISTPELKVPHLGIEHRTFVLVPLLEVAPELVHPVSGKSIRQSLTDLREPLPTIRVYSSNQTEQNS